MTEALQDVIAEVRERVTPDAEERQHLEDVAGLVVSRAETALAALDVETDVVRVGSTARDTWIAGDRDIDVFVRFPPDLARERLAEFGLEVGYAALPDGHEEYAEHPYVFGQVEGFDVDVVPCYDVPSATEAQSAVDRTPFHTEYVRERLDDPLAGEVRVLKQFCTAAGVYGSDLRTRGFSGYLTELLVLEFGGVRPLLQAAAEWHPPVRLDPADHGERSFDGPLTVVDPTDPDRNVAAVVTAENLARFERREPPPLDAAAVREAFDARGTTPVALRFGAPDVVEDQLWPQLDRSLDGVTGALQRGGFDVLRSAAFADDATAVLFAELAVVERPAVERHDGPPVHVREHAEEFYETYADADATGPFLDGARYVVERERAHTNAPALLRSDALFDVALGAQVAEALEDGYEVLVGDDVGELADSFGVELARYLDPKP